MFRLQSENTEEMKRVSNSLNMTRGNNRETILKVAFTLLIFFFLGVGMFSSDISIDYFLKALSAVLK